MRLTESQRRAVQHRGGHLQLIACAGSGKTEVPECLEHEVLNEIQQALLVDRHSKQSGLTASTDLKGVPLRRFVDTGRYIEAMSILREAEYDEKLLADRAEGGLRRDSQPRRGKGSAASRRRRLHRRGEGARALRGDCPPGRHADRQAGGQAARGMRLPAPLHGGVRGVSGVP